MRTASAHGHARRIHLCNDCDISLDIVQERHEYILHTRISRGSALWAEKADWALEGESSTTARLSSCLLAIKSWRAQQIPGLRGRSTRLTPKSSFTRIVLLRVSCCRQATTITLRAIHTIRVLWIANLVGARIVPTWLFDGGELCGSFHRANVSRIARHAIANRLKTSIRIPCTLRARLAHDVRLEVFAWRSRLTPHSCAAHCWENGTIERALGACRATHASSLCPHILIGAWPALRRINRARLIHIVSWRCGLWFGPSAPAIPTWWAIVCSTWICGVGSTESSFDAVANGTGHCVVDSWA
jgi:hypothetical protein